MSKTVTRYAPSPTGNPHVGNIRTAIFAYLWAKHNSGKFLLRIEDTDRERMVPESLRYIEESLAWLGLQYDDEKIFQSERRRIHQEYAQKLLSEGKAYKCFCTKERLDTLRKNQAENKLPPGYDRFCRGLSEEEVTQREENGDKAVIRFAMPLSGTAKWNDLVRGNMEIDYCISDDPIIIKSDGWPTYHLASVVDDHEQKVTDVIRAEEWLPSTPKHIALYDAFGWEVPNFAHLPHINGSDGTKLSKRHGDTAILEYKKQGYLPDAMLNFLALLGWNDGTEKEIFTREELVRAFDLARVGKAPAVFDKNKLDWINGQYIRKIEDKELAQMISEAYPTEKLIKLGNFERIVSIEKNRLSKLSDIFSQTEYFQDAPKVDPKLIVFKRGTKEGTIKGLQLFKEKLEAVTSTELSVAEYERLLQETVKTAGITNGDLYWPVRVALSGLEKSPSPAELLWVLGKEEGLSRIKNSLRLF